MANSGGGSGNWLMTYADFITLMMIFFIVLYTFTPGVEKSKFTAIVGAFQGQRGILQYDSIFSDEIIEIEIQRARNWEEMYRYTEDEGLEDVVTFELIPDGIKITLGEQSLFDSYSTYLKPASVRVLNEIVFGLESYTDEPIATIEIQGHTDDKPVRVSEGRKYEDNWELGAGRALSVMNYLEKHGPFGSEIFSITSFGEYQPLEPNSTPENRQKNRRVEVLIKYQQPTDN